MATARLTLLFGLAYAAMAAEKHPKAAPVDPSQKVRVFVGESESFFASFFGTASAAGKNAGAVSSSSAGIEKMTVLVMKTLNDKCPIVIVVNQPDKADYFLRLDRNGVFVRSNAMAVFNRSGEMVFAGASVSLAKEVKRFCAGLPQSH
jgi:hypothetical protein